MVKKLDITATRCPICNKRPVMKRIKDEVVCELCGYASPIILVNHRLYGDGVNA